MDGLKFDNRREEITTCDKVAALLYPFLRLLLANQDEMVRSNRGSSAANSRVFVLSYWHVRSARKGVPKFNSRTDLPEFSKCGDNGIATLTFSRYPARLSMMSNREHLVVVILLESRDGWKTF
jgi:hypothetical protein